MWIKGGADYSGLSTKEGITTYVSLKDVARGNDIYNFRRIVNILGIKMIKKWLKSFFNLNLVFRKFIGANRIKCENHFRNLLLTQMAHNRFWRLGFCTN